MEASSEGVMRHQVVWWPSPLHEGQVISPPGTDGRLFAVYMMCRCFLCSIYLYFCQLYDLVYECHFGYLYIFKKKGPHRNPSEVVLPLRWTDD